MAGVKGKSGGARPNTGGARPGAGRKKAVQPTLRTSGSVWMKTRERIFERDGGKCQCQRCQSSAFPLDADEVDHIIPLHLGGADADENLQALNHQCHKEKTAQEAANRAAAQLVAPEQASDSLEFLRKVMNDLEQDPKLRVRAAISLAQYEHAKKVGGVGKKEEAADKAKQVGAGKFAPSAPPQLKRVH